MRCWMCRNGWVGGTYQRELSFDLSRKTTVCVPTRERVTCPTNERRVSYMGGRRS